VISLVTAQPYGKFYDTYTIVKFSDKELVQLDSIEDELRNGIKRAIDNHKWLISYDMAVVDDDAPVYELRPYPLYAPDSIESTNLYEIHLVWEANFTYFSILGISRLYKFRANQWYGRRERIDVTGPLYRVSLCAYDDLLSIERIEQLKSFAMKGLKNTINSDTTRFNARGNATQRVLYFKDFQSLPQAPLAELRESYKYTTIGGVAPCYRDADLTDQLLSMDEIDSSYFNYWGQEYVDGVLQDVNLGERSCHAIILSETWTDAPISDTLSEPVKKELSNYDCRDIAKVHGIKKQIKAIGFVWVDSDPPRTIHSDTLWYNYNDLKYVLSWRRREPTLFEAQFNADLIMRFKPSKFNLGRD